MRCQVLREIAYPTTSPDLHEIRYLHPGLLTQVAFIAVPRSELKGHWMTTGAIVFELTRPNPRP